jgi:hypothetical protein
VKRLTTAFREYVAVGGQLLMATCGQILMAAHILGLGRPAAAD